MKRARVVVGTVALLGAWVALGAPDVDPWVKNYARFQHLVPQAFEQSIQFNFADGGTVNASVVSASTVKVGGVSVAPIAFSCDEDFASIPSGYFGRNPLPCAATGVRLGAPCVVGVLAAVPSDAGSAWYGGAGIVAVARIADTVEINVFNQLGDGGALNLPDAGFGGYCFN